MATSAVPAAPDLGAPRLDVLPLASFRCQGCGAALDWSQPDRKRPGKLLGVCGRCGDWHVFKMRPGARVAACLSIPNHRRVPSVPAISTPIEVRPGVGVPGAV